MPDNPQDSWSSRPVIVASSAQPLRAGIHVCGRSRELLQSADLLAANLTAGRLARAGELIKNCTGSFWGWLEASDRTWIFTDRWGSYPVFRGRLKTGEETIFSHFPDVIEKLDLSSNNRLLATYLVLGYLPGQDTLFENTKAFGPGQLIEFYASGERSYSYVSFPFGSRIVCGEQESRKQLRNRLLAAVSRALDGVGEVCFSLSSGVDSRGLLIAALECLPANRIYAFTYGSPGTFDYELSKQVARAAGIHLHLYPLSIHDYSIQAVNALAHDCGGQIFFIPQPPITSFAVECSGDRPVMVGFAGGPLTGSHIFPEPTNPGGRQDWAGNLLKRHQWLPPQAALSCLKEGIQSEGEFTQFLLERYFTEPDDSETWDALALADHWDFVNRQRKYNLFCTAKLRDRQVYLYPFLDPGLADFLWALPLRDRFNRSAYLDVLKGLSPRLFEIPTSRSFGGPTGKTRPGRPHKAVHALRFWVQYNCLHGVFNLHIRENYLPFHRYFNDGWQVIHFLKDHKEQLPALNWDQFHRDLGTIRQKGIFAKAKDPEVKRATGFINLGLALLMLGITPPRLENQG